MNKVDYTYKTFCLERENTPKGNDEHASDICKRVGYGYH